MSEMPFLLKLDRVKLNCPNCDSIPSPEDMIRKAAPSFRDIAPKLDMMSEVLQDLALTLEHLKGSDVNPKRCAYKNITVTITGGCTMGTHEKKSFSLGSQQVPKKTPGNKGTKGENVKPGVSGIGGLASVASGSRAEAEKPGVAASDPTTPIGPVKNEPEDAGKEGDVDEAAAVNKGQ